MTTWLTVIDAAKYINATGTEIIRAAIKAGELPACRYGKSEIRLTTEDVDNWLKSQPWEPRA
jgi:excisionase family DNA binding protein